MRLITGIAPLLLITGILSSGVTMATSETTPVTTRGELIGSQLVTHPEWFVESFLDIAEDAASAGDEGKHVILFFDSPGCPYCYKMIEENFKHSSYTEFIQDNFHTIALNIRGDREVAFREDLHPRKKNSRTS